jgi:uncharacterized protein
VDLRNFIIAAKKAAAENKKFLGRLKKKKPADLDHIVHDLHEKAFSKINCMDCANCCKTISPVFTLKDIDRLANHFKLKSSVFIEKYLYLDEDRDYVLQKTPCPFLAGDNSCTVYEYKPAACAEYPHTNKRKIHQLLDLTSKNTTICPAVFEIVEELKKKY